MNIQEIYDKLDRKTLIKRSALSIKIADAKIYRLVRIIDVKLKKEINNSEENELNESEEIEYKGEEELTIIIARLIKKITKIKALITIDITTSKNTLKINKNSLDF